MSGAVFLSASIPDPRKPHFIDHADTIDVTTAVRSLVYAILGRRRLVWGGHPAITPMVWSIAESMGVDYGEWVTLYQTTYYDDEYPDDNEKFKNVHYIEGVLPSPDLSEEDRLKKSLLRMREAMFSENEFQAAIFIGGMGGIIDEFAMFGKICPDAVRIPVLSTGGATAQLAATTADAHPEVDLARLRDDIDYVPLFYDLCGIDPREPRGQFLDADEPGPAF